MRKRDAFLFMMGDSRLCLYAMGMIFWKGEEKITKGARTSARRGAEIQRRKRKVCILS